MSLFPNVWESSARRRGGEGEEARKVRFRWRVRISGHRASNFLIKTYEYGTKIHASLGSTIYRSDGMIVDVVDWSVGTRVRLTCSIIRHWITWYSRNVSVILRWNSKFNFDSWTNWHSSIQSEMWQEIFIYCKKLFLIFFLTVFYFYLFPRLRDIEFNAYIYIFVYVHICSREKYIMKYLF